MDREIENQMEQDGAKRELAKTYAPGEIEGRIYRRWMEKKLFGARADKSRKPFTIVMPPPNITGQLHMGHALDNTMQDVLIRFKRMQGYNALWQPGTDHASIATEVKILEKMQSEGLSKADLGREGFLERAWEWKEEYGGRIISQLKKLGASCDWDRERFTMDEGCSRAVLKAFVLLYEKGMIYKGHRMINWCPTCRTSISDAEVEYQEKEGNLWHICYPLLGEDGQPSREEFLTFATSRPETMLGDTALAVHPEDERYRAYQGRMAWLPLQNRAIPIVADGYVDKDFGTGVVKITPAHDPNDHEVGKRHGLPLVQLLEDDGSISPEGGAYAGMDRYAAREAVLRDLEALGYLVKVQAHTHNVGVHDRCKTVLEPMVKEQWFVRMEELADMAARGVREGEIQLIPKRLDKIFFHWTDNIRDWCISRQLWWGHRIPAYTCTSCGYLTVSEEAPQACPVCGHGELAQDEDTLDTWFSSALWPFATLGWPEQTEDLAYFYPTDVLVTGYDILFFWVFRMIFSGYAHMGEKPFHTVLFHGLIRDSQGRKMSKSLGNGIDPLEVISQYGADALRMTLLVGNAPGNDMRFYYERVENSRNFANKIWNASRFLLMNLDVEEPERGTLAMVDKWICSKLQALVEEVSQNLERYELGVAVQKVYDFIWDEYCDWYIEMAKPRLYGNGDGEDRQTALWTLRYVLGEALKLLHPFMPFITEEIYLALYPREESIMVSDWPRVRQEFCFPGEEAAIERIKEAVRGIRGARTAMQVHPSKKTTVYIVSPQEEILEDFRRGAHVFAPLAFASSIETLAPGQLEFDDGSSVSAVIPGATVYLPLAELVDVSKELERLAKEKARLESEIRRVEGMLSNPRFMEKAPQSKIQEERDKEADYRNMLGQVLERIAAMEALA